MASIAQGEIAVPRRRATQVALTPASVWRLAVGWALLVPMLYIAANGTFIPRAGDIDYAATGQTPGSSASHKVSVALFCLSCIALIASRFSSVVSISRRMKIVLAFPLLAILSAAWSTDPVQSVVSGEISLIFTVFAIYVAVRLPVQKQFELIMLVGAVVLPVSIALALLVPSIGATEVGWRGVFGHKQICAAVSTFWLVTALHWKCSGIYQKVFRPMYIIMSCVLIVMSKSRTGWALALVALLLTAAVWLLQRMPAKQSLAMLLLGLAAAAAAAYGIYIYFPSLLASIGKDSTLSERTIIWSAAWAAASQHPMLGYGFAAFWKGLYGPSQSVVLTAGWGLQQAQDGFLDVWLGIGVFGVALVALMTGQAMRNAVSCFYSQSTKAYVRWCVVIILCTLFYNIGESSIGSINMNWFLFLLASIGLSQAARAKES